MDTQQFPQYFALFGTSAILLDVYFTVSLRRYLKELKMPRLVASLPWLLFTLALVCLAYTLYIRIYAVVPGAFAEYVLGFAVTWYAPKGIIGPILIVKDIIHLVQKRLVKRSKKKISRFRRFNIQQRKQFLRDAGWLFSILPFALIVHSLIGTTYNFEVKEINIPLSEGHPALKGFRIVHLSDIHAGSFASEERFGEAVAAVNALKPDIVVITGDFVSFHPVELCIIEKGLKQIKTKYGVYGCLGNHDHYMYPEDHKMLIDKLARCGVRMLTNENIRIGVGADTLQLAGMDNVSYRHDFGDLDEALVGLTPGFPVVLLLHDPYAWASRIRDNRMVGLTLCGHTHGGQMVVNVDGITLSHMRLRYSHWRGLYHENGSRLYITAGLGSMGLPFRIGVYPEITVVNL